MGLRPAGGKAYWPLPTGVLGTATFSDDGEYRYVLWRTWGSMKDDGYVAFVGLNPSTADEGQDDPTVRRCWKMARDWGVGGMAMLNIYGYRATSPTSMRKQADPVGPDNDEHVRAVCAGAEAVIACWGASAKTRGEEVAQIILGSGRRTICVLRLTQTGQPHHPLYLPSGLKPAVWRRAT